MTDIYAPDGEFLMPYIKRESAALPESPDVAVMISSSDIYLPADAWLDEDSEIDKSSKWHGLEAEFTSRAHSAGKKVYILRCAPIIGTGMTGQMRRLAEEIYRGVFFHFPGNEARKSVVHASDVARAAVFLANSGAEEGVYNLSDGIDPTLHDIAEALAYRMDNKRISNLSTKPQQWFGRIVYGRERYRRYTTSVLVSANKLSALGFTPADTCSYMRSHIYDDSSL